MSRVSALSSAFGVCFWLVSCSTSVGCNWGDQATYHAVVVASQYQQQLEVVVAKISWPGATADKIESSVAKPLEVSVVKLPGVNCVKTQSSHGRFLMEVHFKQPAGDDQLAQVKQVIDGFWQGRSTSGELPTVTLDRASLL